MMEIKRVNVNLVCLFIAVFAASVAVADENSIAEPAKDVSMNELMAQAAAQKSTEEGSRYWWQVFEELDKLSDEPLVECAAGKSDPNKMYKYVLEILEGGKVKQVHWENADGFTQCIDRVLLEIRFPSPPESPYYFYLSEI